MKYVYTIVNIALLLLTAGSAFALEGGLLYPTQNAEPNKALNNADKEFIFYIDDYFANPQTPFPVDFKNDMLLSTVNRHTTNLFIQLKSSSTFKEVRNPLEDPLLAADLISEGYFYKLGFLYTDDNSGVCENDKFKGTQGSIKINYDFPNIGYKTQITKSVREICGWSNNDEPQKVNAQRNLFYAYAKTIARALNTNWSNKLTDKTLSLSVEPNETLLYILRGQKQQYPVDTEKLFKTVFPETMCQLTNPFQLLNIKVRIDVLVESQFNPQIFEETANSLCIGYVKNIFNLK